MKKIFAVLVMVSLVLVMAACKPEEKKGYSPITTTEPETPSTTDTSTTTPTETTTTTPAETTTPVAETGTTPTTTTPAETETAKVNESYYIALAESCKGTGFPDCCNQSVNKMKDGNFMLSSDINCPTGFSSERLTCMGSLRWCVPTVTNSEMYCDATADCVPKPICHPIDCINKKYESNYVMPPSCELPYYVDRAYKVDDCECINHKCTNKKA